jgi:hypothetical protein
VGLGEDVERYEGSMNKPGLKLARALWYIAPRAELRTQSLSRAEDAALIRTVWSAVSRGTERLVSHGHVSPMSDTPSCCNGRFGHTPAFGNPAGSKALCPMGLLRL